MGQRLNEGLMRGGLCPYTTKVVNGIPGIGLMGVDGYARLVVKGSDAVRVLSATSLNRLSHDASIARSTEYL